MSPHQKKVILVILAAISGALVLLVLWNVVSDVRLAIEFGGYCWESFKLRLLFIHLPSLAVIVGSWIGGFWIRRRRSKIPTALALIFGALVLYMLWVFLVQIVMGVTV